MPEGNSDEIDLANFNIEERIKMLEEHADEMWTMLAGYFLFLQIIIRAVIVLMQLGFAFLEGGCVRYKNMQSIMIKVFANAAISIIMTWIVTILIFKTIS
jgi:Amt family ammonium transporter